MIEKLRAFLQIPLVSKLWQFVKFGIVGLSNTLISYAVYLAGLKIGLHYLFADALGLLISTLNAYYWNNRCVFGDGNRKSLREHFVTWLKTLTAYGGTYGLNVVLLILWVQVVKVPEELAPLLNLLITIPINFVINKYWTFRKKK